MSRLKCECGNEEKFVRKIHGAVVAQCFKQNDLGTLLSINITYEFPRGQDWVECLKCGRIVQLNSPAVPPIGKKESATRKVKAGVTI